MGYCMLIRTYFIDHVLHIINFMETLYTFIMFFPSSCDYLACGTFSEIQFLIICQPELLYIIKANFYQLKKNIFRSIILMKQCFDLFDKH